MRCNTIETLEFSDFFYFSGSCKKQKRRFGVNFQQCEALRNWLMTLLFPAILQADGFVEADGTGLG